MRIKLDNLQQRIGTRGSHEYEQTKRPNWTITHEMDVKGEKRKKVWVMKIHHQLHAIHKRRLSSNHRKASSHAPHQQQQLAGRGIVPPHASSLRNRMSCHLSYLLTKIIYITCRPI